MRGILGFARYGTAHVAAATLAILYSLAIIVLLYLGLLARAVYWHQVLGSPMRLPVWPLVTGLASLLTVLVVYAPATALTDWVFRHRSVDLSRSNLALSLTLTVLGTGLFVWFATSSGPPTVAFLSVVCVLAAPGFAIYWVVLHVMDGTLEYAGQAVATTLQLFGWSSE